MPSLKENSVQFFKKHWVGILIALAIGVIISAPPVIFRFSKDYKGFPMMKTNTEDHYVAQVKEVYDGHYGLGNPFFADLKNTPYLFPPFSPIVMGLFGKFFHLDIVTDIMVLRFIITSSMAFFIYLFVTELSKNKFAGYVAAPFVMLGYSLVDPGYILAIIRERGIPSHAGFIDYGRPVNPQMSSLLFFSYLYFFWRALYGELKQWKIYAVISAVILGLSFYAYLFTWTFLFTLNGFLFLVYAWKKDWNIVKRIAIVSIGGAFLGIPYSIHQLEVSSHPWYAEVVPRFGFVHMRVPSVSRLVVGAFILFLLLLRCFDESMRRFFTAFFLAAFFVVNEQVVTNIFIFNHHYHWYYNTPIVIIFFSILLFFLPAVLPASPNRGERGRPRLRLFKKLKAPVIAIIFCTVFFVYGIAAQAVAYSNVLPIVKEEQRYTPLIEWLNLRTLKDSTVFATPEITAFIPVLTHNNVNYHGTAVYTLVSDERLLDQYLFYLYLDRLPKENIRSYLETHRNDISGFAFGYTYSFVQGVCFGCFPDSVIDDLVKKYTIISDGSLLYELQKYPIDYIVWDKQKNPMWLLDRFKFQKEAKFGDIFVYKALVK